MESTVFLEEVLFACDTSARRVGHGAGEESKVTKVEVSVTQFPQFHFPQQLCRWKSSGVANSTNST
jgi:hypothetical protein